MARHQHEIWLNFLLIIRWKWKEKDKLWVNYYWNYFLKKFRQWRNQKQHGGHTAVNSTKNTPPTQGLRQYGKWGGKIPPFFVCEKNVWGGGFLGSLGSLWSLWSTGTTGISVSLGIPVDPWELTDTTDISTSLRSLGSLGSLGSPGTPGMLTSLWFLGTPGMWTSLGTPGMLTSLGSPGPQGRDP